MRHGEAAPPDGIFSREEKLSPEAAAFPGDEPLPPDELLAKAPQILEAVAGGPLRTIKPFTREVRAEIDNELVAKSIEFMQRQSAAGRPFFLYLPFSTWHTATS